MKKIFGYARVSSKDQNLDRQLDALKKYVPNPQDIFYDKQSGKDFNRPKYQQLRLMLREGDELYLTELDRLGTNKNEIKLSAKSSPVLSNQRRKKHQTSKNEVIIKKPLIG